MNKTVQEQVKGLRPDRTPDVVLHGRCVVPGMSEGEALVTRMPISGWGGIDSRTGVIVETRHELRGISFAGKVLVFPGAKGSSGWSNAFHLTRTFGVAPAAMLFNDMSTKMALGAVVTRAPSVTDFDQNPLDVIQTGDWVRVDGERGVVEVYRRRDKTDGPQEPGVVNPLNLVGTSSA